jgi:glyoxylate reductase
MLAAVKVLATRRYPGPAFDELDDVEVAGLDTLGAPREDLNGLIVANEPVPLDLLPALKIVANFGVGYDRIDVAACAARGVTVTNTPGVLDAATADLSFGLIMAVRREIVVADRFVRSAGWSGSWSEGGLAEELSGSTLGIVGLGRIGRAVARRARGFDLRVLYTQRRRSDSDLGEYRELDALLTESDLVSIHAPLTPETGLIDAAACLLRTGPCSSTRRAERSWTSERWSPSSSRAGSPQASTSSRTSQRCRRSCSSCRTSSSRRTSAARRVRRARR